MTDQRKNWLYGGAVAFLLILAICLRLYDLEPKPVHHDESLHAFFSWQLFKTGHYAYDPMLHGPLLYYQIALADRLFGVSDATARIMPALAGIGLVGLLPALRPILGRRGVLVAMTMATTSPMLVYVSRFARHDMWSLLCTLVVIVCTLRYLVERRPIYVYGAVLAFGLSYANHELTYITIVIWIFSSLYASRTSPEPGAVWRSLARVGPHILVAITGAVVLVLVFYSSFYSNPIGVLKALPNPMDPGTALGYWVTQHGVHRANQPPYFYVLLLSLYEIVPFALGLIGAIAGLRSSDGGWRFLSCFAILSLVAYSAAGERMPWLTIHPLLPLLLAASYLVARREGGFASGPRKLLATGFAVAMAFTLFNAVRLSYWNPANPIEMAVYTQSQPGLKRALQQISKEYRASVVSVDQELSWPTAWYLRDVPSASFVKGRIDAPVTLSATHPKAVAVPEKSAASIPVFNEWWTPPSGWPGFRNLAGYYFGRRIWGVCGGTCYDLKTEAVAVKAEPHALTGHALVVGGVSRQPHLP